MVLSMNTEEVLNFLNAHSWSNNVLLMMSSGNFDGINYDELAATLIAKNDAAENKGNNN